MITGLENQRLASDNSHLELQQQIKGQQETIKELENNLALLNRLAESELTEREQLVSEGTQREQAEREKAGRLIHNLSEERRGNSLLRAQNKDLKEQNQTGEEKKQQLRQQRDIFQTDFVPP